MHFEASTNQFMGPWIPPLFFLHGTQTGARAMPETSTQRSDAFAPESLAAAVAAQRRLAENATPPAKTPLKNCNLRNLRYSPSVRKYSRFLLALSIGVP
jgi:hypothetical protein